MNHENENNRYNGYGQTPPETETNTPEVRKPEPQYAPEPADADPFARNSDVSSSTQDFPELHDIVYAPPTPEPINPHSRRTHPSYRYDSGPYPGDLHDFESELHHPLDWPAKQRQDPRHPEWREPTYSELRESTSGMYTPGICVTHPHSRNRTPEAEHEREIRPRERPRQRGGFLRAVCLVIVCILFSGAASYIAMDYRFNRGDFTIVNQVVLGGNNSSTPVSESISAPVTTSGMGMTSQDIYDMAVTQVVGIKVEAQSSGFFGSGGGGSSSGSGFIISSDGYILTNYHVIEQAYLNDTALSVSLSNGDEYDAKIIGFEASNDVALLKIEATGLNPAIIANSDNIRVGQPVYAVGNPFGNLVYTMTDGIVSALDREVTVDGKIISTFQFSAAVNRGNSGGPVYDANGEVLGIVTAKLIRNDVEGIGFAIPINDAIEIASGLIEHGYIAGRPLIGITTQTVSGGHAEYYGWVVGAYVRTVNPDSAAQRAGLLVGDIIIGIGDVEVDSLESLRFAMRRYKAGDAATLTVWRAGEEKQLSIIFDEDLAAGQPQRQQSVQPEGEFPPRLP